MHKRIIELGVSVLSKVLRAFKVCVCAFVVTEHDIAACLAECMVHDVKGIPRVKRCRIKCMAGDGCKAVKVSLS